ncbi:hypothetical protein Tco_1485282 [Tanacetum coccineum]|uniref:Uncharacterized protein n=1 Tax=Tanacetum coccineum TaxID=301880 RepID=A0ABQ5F4B4_9ASTR
MQKSQRRGRNGPYNNQNGNVIKWEQTHKHKEQRVHSGNIWTKKPKSGNVANSERIPGHVVTVPMSMRQDPMVAATELIKNEESDEEMSVDEAMKRAKIESVRCN